MATVMVVVALVVNASALSAASPKTLVVSGDGLSVVALGARENLAMTRVTTFLGAPTTALESAPSLGNCGVDASASWHALTLYFDTEKLVGVALGPGAIPSGVTSKGLRLGDALRRAERLYGRSLRTSTNQGGAWFVTSASGTIDGFLAPSNGRPTPTSWIMTIDAGVVGCPAMSP